MPAAPRPLVHLAQGLLMGAADVVPGVSGGTVALVVGIYARLVSSIRAATAAPAALVRGGPAAARARLAEVDWPLVLPLAGGIALAIGAGSVLIPPLLEAYRAETSAVFFGLIVASLALPWGRIRKRGPGSYALAGGAALLAFTLVGLPELAAGDPSTLRIASSAAVAICAMILPGVSGAFLLAALGIYEATLTALRELDVVYIATFAAGAVIGLGAFAKLLETLLARRHDLTMAALTGLMVGALRALWPWLGDGRTLEAPPASVHSVLVVALGVAAFAALRLLLRAGARRATQG